MASQITKDEIDRLTASFFALFSNRGGAQPEVARARNLFAPGGVIARCVDTEPEVLTLEEFIAPRQLLLADGTLTGFQECETSETTLIFGHIAQRTSFYQKSGLLNGVPFTARGVKSFQFLETPEGWRILSMLWDDERPGFALDGMG
jgi:ribosomal-protein-serine acetyltransferase